jgi:hypothetical protein
VLCSKFQFVYFRENKEMNNFITLLDTTLHMNKEEDDKSEEDDDEQTIIVHVFELSSL